MLGKIKRLSRKEKVAEIQNIVSDPSKRILCDNHWWCGLEDGYCPTYRCGALETLNRYSDRQWANAIKQAERDCGVFTNEYEFIDIVLYILRYKRPRYKRSKKQ